MARILGSFSSKSEAMELASRIKRQTGHKVRIVHNSRNGQHAVIDYSIGPGAR